MESSSRPPEAAQQARRVRRLSPQRRALFVLITLTMLSLLIAGFSELAIRIVSPQPASWLDFYRRHPVLPLYSMQANAHRLVDTGETYWTATTDSHGHRVGEKHAATNDSRPVLLAVGDSFTFGNGLSYADTFVGRIATAAGAKYRVMNTAVGGYGPKQYADTLEYEISAGTRPETVFVGTFLGNDFHDCVWDKDAPVHAGVVGDDGGLRAAVARNSHLYRLITKVLHVMVPGPTHTNDVERQLYQATEWKAPFMTQALRTYEQSMARIAALAAANHSQLLVAIIPARQTIEWLRTPEGQRDKSIDATLPVQQATAVLQRLQIPFVDLTPSLVGHATTDLYFAYDGHFTKLGSQIAAAAISEKLPPPR